MGQPSKEAKARYRERDREELLRKGREYAYRKAREAGVPLQGSPESSENRRRARKATGPEHGNWKGDEVGYFALHAWVKRNKKRTGTCSDCGATPTKKRGVGTEWANVSKTYKRDLNDWIELCSSCHQRFDMTEAKRERLRKMSQIPRVLSDETRAKLRAAALRGWEKRRQN